MPSPEGAACGACLAQPPAYDATFALWTYAFPLDRLIVAFKFHARLQPAPWFAAALAERIPHETRQLITVAALTVIGRTEELKLHMYGALNVGCTPQQVAEVIFQCGIYGGMPVVNQALKVLREVLQEKGRWPLEEQA